jgi:hypothetical protein
MWGLNTEELYIGIFLLIVSEQKDTTVNNLINLITFTQQICTLYQSFSTCGASRWWEMIVS